MTDGGVSENIATILMVALLVIIAAAVSIYTFGIADDSISGDNPPKYAYVTAEVIPALSGVDTWEADSIRVGFIAGQKTYQNASKGAYTGTEVIRFLLTDPDGNPHEAMQSSAMKDKMIDPGSTFYIYTTDVNGPYQITNQYARIGDDSTWGGLAYLKPFKAGTWQVVIVDDSTNTIIASKEVEIS